MKTLDLPNGRLRPKKQNLPFITMEHDRLETELSDLSARLLDFENQYNLPSEQFYQRFQAGKMGDDADMFEWSAFYQMYLSKCSKTN